MGEYHDIQPVFDGTHQLEAAFPVVFPKIRSDDTAGIGKRARGELEIESPRPETCLALGRVPLKFNLRSVVQWTTPQQPGMRARGIVAGDNGEWLSE